MQVKSILLLHYSHMTLKTVCLILQSIWQKLTTSYPDLVQQKVRIILQANKYRVRFFYQKMYGDTSGFETTVHFLEYSLYFRCFQLLLLLKLKSTIHFT